MYNKSFVPSKSEHTVQWTMQNRLKVVHITLPHVSTPPWWVIPAKRKWLCVWKEWRRS